MSSCEWEDGLSMIEDELGPLRRQVAGATILEELASMDIGFKVTLRAEPWDPRPLTIDMACFALHVKMAADQNVTRKLMRKERLAPGIRCMTSATLDRYKCGMDVFLEMAPFTLGWSSLQHAQILRTGMTASTVEKHMLTLERKLRSAMVKRGAIGIQSVMTSQAGRGEVTDMLKDIRGIVR